MQDPYEKPAHGWTCFHCGETFTTVGAARDHFGAEPSAVPGCMLKVEFGAERGLLMALRKSEELLAGYMSEDTELHRALYRMQSRHADALRDAEEAGYARGLRDGMRMTPGERAKVLSNGEAQGCSGGTVFEPCREAPKPPRKFTGPGYLEQTGYIPAGSAAEREGS